MNEWQTYAIEHPWLKTPESKALDKRHVRSVEFGVGKTTLIVVLSVCKARLVLGGRPVWQVSVVELWPSNKPAKMHPSRMHYAKQVVRHTLKGVGANVDWFHVGNEGKTFHGRRALIPSELEKLSREWLAEPPGEDGEAPTMTEVVPLDVAPGQVLFTGELKEIGT